MKKFLNWLINHIMFQIKIHQILSKIVICNMIFQKNKILTNKILHNYWINIKNYSIKIK